jgi:uncharacterized membrane protein
MAASTIRSNRVKRKSRIKVRQISGADLRFSLKAGLDDFLAMRGDLLFAGLLYVLVGLLAAVVARSGNLLPFLFPIVAGVGLLGPLAAVGFYELARRREDGLESSWKNFLDVQKRPSADDIGIVAGMLLAIFALWLLTAGVLWWILFGAAAPASIPEFLSLVFATPRGWMLILLGSGAGAVFGWLVMATSVVAMPMLVDRDVSAGEAVSASWRAVQANRDEMLRWGMIVTALLVLGTIPLFIGLAFVLPWLGYSTWHLYTRLVDRDSLPRKPRR